MTAWKQTPYREASEVLTGVMCVIKLRTQMKTFVCFMMLSYSIKSLFRTHTNETGFEQSRWLTIAGCLLLRARLALGKAGERPLRLPLCTEDSRLCMSEWAPSKPGPWPTAWLRSTWMASSKRSSILLCYINTRGMHLKISIWQT